jgi:hypothetical protein
VISFRVHAVTEAPRGHEAGVTRCWRERAKANGNIDMSMQCDNLEIDDGGVLISSPQQPQQDVLHNYHYIEFDCGQGDSEDQYWTLDRMFI